MSAVKYVMKFLRSTPKKPLPPLRKASSSTASNLKVDDDVTENEKLAWKLCASTALIRQPLVEPKKNGLEQTFEDFMSKVEYEKSVLSEWEIEKERQTKLIKKIEAGKAEASSLDFKFSNQELEDGFEVSLKQLKESFEEETPDDGDVRNPNRRCREPLVLITKQKLGKDHVWMLPVKEWVEGETLRETAENSLSCVSLDNVADSKIAPTFISNAPSTFYKYKIPKIARHDASCVGVKLFIFSAFVPRNSYASSQVDVKVYSNENITDNENVVDYAWVAADEMRKFMKPKYVDVLQGIIM